MKLCIICGDPVPYGRCRYCSLGCAHTGWQNKKNTYREKYLIKPFRRAKCLHCEAEFKTKQPGQLFCSGTCRKTHGHTRAKAYMAAYNRKRYVRKGRYTIAKVCCVCGKPFVGLVVSRYCSKPCQRQSPAGQRQRQRQRKNAYNKARRATTQSRYHTDPVYRAQVIRKVHERAKRDPIARIKNTLRARVRKLLKGGHSQTQSNLLGCSSIQLRLWLRFKFDKGMSWSNYGTYWVVDHRIPLAKYDLTDPAQRKIACHYTNLQPLRRDINQAKGDKIEDGQMALLI